MLKEIAGSLKGPSYVLDVNRFNKRIDMVRNKLSDGIGLVFSIKANPFLTKYSPDTLKYIEVCSPGELTICEKSGVDLSRVIFSGVNKTKEDVDRAMDDNVGIFTAESIKHANLINEAAVKAGKVVPIILRLSCGNQFGMDKKDICKIIENATDYKGLDIIGLHMYTGTQKKKSSIIEKELGTLGEFIDELKEKYGFNASHIEYGPGIATDYFSEDSEEKDIAMLDEVSSIINEFAKKYPVTIEMGRFLACTCGTYLTTVMDTKLIEDINYCICDGGVHQVKYFGQTMAMQVPHIDVFKPVDDVDRDWSVCGSLCTTADVLVRKCTLKGVGEGSVLAFDKVGAYSICEGIALFLSRELPAVYIIDKDNNVIEARDIIYISNYNMEVDR